ncbi:MAG: 30S ribosomal protein S2 [Sneathiellaceae bacterium]
MALPTFTMRQLLEAGVHFGHQTHRWNPRMKPFIFGDRNNIHIIDLRQTVPLMHRALETLRDITAGGGRVLFVATKRQAAEPIAKCAESCGQYYINHRWLGGMLTNWQTISHSIRRLKELESKMAEDPHALGLTKKEHLTLSREHDKLQRSLGGIKEMGGLPDVLVIIDVQREDIAVAEAKKLGIPVIAVVDTNTDPNDITYPVPGNDDALRAIHLYCDLFSAAVLDGIQAEMSRGGDMGDMEDPMGEQLPGTEFSEGEPAPADTTPAPAPAPASAGE